MHHESARRFSLSPGLGLVAGLLVLAAAHSASAGQVVLDPVLPGAPFTRRTSTGERQPVRAFATAAGVYELDAKTKAIRVWPRTARGKEVGADARFLGIDSAGKGAMFSRPVSMAKKPGENVVAVVDASPYMPNDDEAQLPRIAFYSFAETLSGGALSAVSFTLLGEIVNPALAGATDVSFFPSGDRVAVTISRFSSSSTAGDSGAVQFYPVPTSPDAPVTAAENAFLVVRVKTVYEGSASGVGAEDFNVPASSVCVDADGERVYVGSSVLNAVLRYDPVSGDTYDETVTVRTFEYNMTDGVQRVVEDTFPAATADFVQGAVGCTNLFEVSPGFDPGDLGLAGSTNNLISSPQSVQLWASPHGNLLVVAERDNRRVSAFDEAGNARFVFDATDREDTRFANPQGAWVSDDGTELVVADSGNGRVEIFSLPEAAIAPDESFEVTGLPAFYFESDSEPHTNYVSVAAASLTNRTYAVSVTGPVLAEPAEVTVPAGALSAPFALVALDGAEGGTECTLDVGGWTASFTVSNVAPTVRTGPLTEASVDNQSYLYMEEASLNTAMSSGPAIGVLREGEEGIHFHAKAFDVAADADLTYEWRVVGTENTLRNIPLTSLSNVVDEVGSPPDPAPNPVYRTTRYYYYEYTEGVPPATKRRTFTEEQVASFPTDAEGNPLFIEVHASQQVAAESWTTTNVLASAVATNVLDQADFLDWPALLFNDPQGAAFIVSDETVTGADAIFPASSAQDGVLYFAILTVTDKDGGVWRSIDSVDAGWFAFVTGPVLPDPASDSAVYSARFTAITPTNLVFEVTVESGTPAAGDTVTVEYATTLVDPVWTPLGDPVDVGTPAAGGEDPVVVDFAPIEGDDARFFHVVQP